MVAKEKTDNEIKYDLFQKGYAEANPLISRQDQVRNAKKLWTEVKNVGLVGPLLQLKIVIQKLIKDQIWMKVWIIQYSRMNLILMMRLNPCLTKIDLILCQSTVV